MTSRLASLAPAALVSSFLFLACASGGGASFDTGDAAALESDASETDDAGRGGDGGKTCAAACAKDEVCSGGACVKLPSKCPCPKEAFCDLASGACKVGCLGEGGCNAGRYCDTATRQCKDGCSADAECGAKKICENHTCTVGCRTCEKDTNDCTSDKCVDGECRHDPLPDGTKCPNDSNYCTIDACKAGKCTHDADPTRPVCETFVYPAKACVGTVCKTPPTYCSRTNSASGTPSYYYNNKLHDSCACSDATHLTVTTTSLQTSTLTCPSGCNTYTDPTLDSVGSTQTYFGCF